MIELNSESRKFIDSLVRDAVDDRVRRMDGPFEFMGEVLLERCGLRTWIKEVVMSEVGNAVAQIKAQFEKYQADVNSKLASMQDQINASSMSEDDKVAIGALIGEIQSADTTLVGESSPDPAPLIPPGQS